MTTPSQSWLDEIFVEKRSREGTIVLVVRFGFVNEMGDSSALQPSPLSTGYIAAAQQEGSGGIGEVRREIPRLVLELPELMGVLIDFFGNSRTKHHSFTPNEGALHIRLDRRKYAMVCLQIDAMQGIYPERAVIAAFREALIRFFEDEYVRVGEGGAESLRAMEREIDAYFRQKYQEFLAWSANR